MEDQVIGYLEQLYNTVIEKYPVGSAIFIKGKVVYITMGGGKVPKYPVEVQTYEICVVEEVINFKDGNFGLRCRRTSQELYGLWRGELKRLVMNDIGNRVIFFTDCKIEIQYRNILGNDSMLQLVTIGK